MESFRRQRVVVLVALATIVNVVPYAMLAPEVVVRLSEAGASATVVAIYGLAPFAVILALSPLTPKVLDAIGLHRAQVAGLATAAVALLATSLLLVAEVARFGPFALLAVAIGAASALTWTATETRIVSGVPVERVGRVTAVYQTGLGLAFAAGPFLPTVFRLDPLGRVSVTAVLMFGAVLLGVAARGDAEVSSAPDVSGDPSHLFQWRVGVVLLAGFVGGVFEIGLNAIFPPVGLEAGLSSDSTVMLVGAVAIGALTSQLPVGAMADRVSVRLSIRSAAATLLLGLCVLEASARTPALLWLGAFLLGGGGGALYTLAMIEVGRARDGPPVAALTSAAVSAYTFGAICGPLGSGLVLDRAGPTVLWIALALLPFVVLTATFIHPRPANQES